MSRTITPAELGPLLEQRAITLLDVRRRNDYAADRVTLPGARWHDPDAIGDWSTRIPTDRDVIIYCARGGSVSNSVVDRLQARGVQARFIEGGIEAWKQAGGAVVDK